MLLPKLEDIIDEREYHPITFLNTCCKIFTANVGNYMKDQADRNSIWDRRVSVPLREKVKATLNDLEKKGIIEKVTVPTEWMASIVVVTEQIKDLNRVIAHVQNTRCQP